MDIEKYTNAREKALEKHDSSKVRELRFGEPPDLVAQFYAGFDAGVKYMSEQEADK